MMYKVVQVRVHDQAGLAVGRKDSVHRRILAAYLIDRGIEYDYMRDYDDEDAPEMRGRHHEVVGAGLGWFNVERRLVKFSGDSMGYGIGINAAHVDEMRRSYPDWSFITP